MKRYISGIQQMGVGVPDVAAAFKFYRRYMGNDIKIFEDAAEAPLMTRYTGGKVESRTATLAINMNGGGGFEIWQFTSRPTQKAAFEIQLSDYGILVTKIKSKDVEATYRFYKKENIKLLSEINQDINGKKHFFFSDPNGNWFEITESENWFSNDKHLCGGVYGAIIGVQNMDESLRFYNEILGYDTVLRDETDVFPDLKNIAGGSHRFRRVLLKHSRPRSGPFSQLLGSSEIELIQALDVQGRRIFENRYWGDWGFIHLCFDIKGMKTLREDCEKAGFPFTVDSGNTFDMGEAGGQFAYVEDPNGVLIEFVETHRIPILKKLGWYLNLNKRPAHQSLPYWLVRALRFNRVKD